MLDDRHERRTGSFAEALQRYLAKTLHAEVRVGAIKAPGGIPAFLAHGYKFYRADVAGRRLLIIAGRQKDIAISDIAKHVRLVRSATGEMVVVFAASSLNARQRSRLLERGIPFIVPDNQLYIPDLAMDLREHFRAQRPASAERLSPAAQAVLFLHLLLPEESIAGPFDFAQRLHFTTMSAGRAFDELIRLNLAEDERGGRERHIRFKQRGRALLDAASAHLRNPVRGVHYVKSGGTRLNLKLAGESALAELTDLSRPQLDTYAVVVSLWTGFARDRLLVETDNEDAEIRVETWSYDPSGLSDKPTVDPLSLYAQYKDNSDERLAGAAERLLEDMSW
jgi:hypothetical protein